MSWKKSKDGGLDYDTTRDSAYKRAKKRMFDPAASAHTVTFNTDIEHVRF